MKKIGLIALAIVLALGTMGIGLAQWTETLNVGGDAETADVNACWRLAESNDNGSTCPEEFYYDGAEVGPPVDPGDNGDDPTGEQTMGMPVARSQNVGCTTVTGFMPNNHALPPDPENYQALTVTMMNVYPSYWATIFYNIINAGTIPCKVTSIKLVQVSGGGWIYPIDPAIELVPCTYYCISVDEMGGGCSITENCVPECPTCTDFVIHISDDMNTLFDVMGTAFQSIDTACGNLSIHIEDCAEEGTLYDFVIEFTVEHFNAGP